MRLIVKGSKAIPGEHPFPTRHENIGPELALTIRRN